MILALRTLSTHILTNFTISIGKTVDKISSMKTNSTCDVSY